jgi:hypothetical protein
MSLYDMLQGELYLIRHVKERERKEKVEGEF